METNVLDDILVEGTTTDTEDQTDFDHSFDLTDDIFTDEDETPVDDEQPESVEDDTDEGGEVNEITNPTNTAFAQMRTQNKEFQNKFNELDSLAKGLGMRDVDDLIARVRDTQIKQNAKEQGIPVEVARELEEMRALKDSIVAEREENAAKMKEQNFVSSVQEFVNKNKLSDSAVDKLSQDLERDGFSLDYLMDLPKGALNRVLNSYVDTKYQQSLERKETIRKELPINQASKIDTESLNKDIDKLARQLAGKM